MGAGVVGVVVGVVVGASFNHYFNRCIIYIASRESLAAKQANEALLTS